MTNEIKLDEVFFKDQISKAVENCVSTIMNDLDWQRDFEKRTLIKINDRLTNKLSTMYEDPKVIHTIQHQIHKMIEGGAMPGIDAYIDHDSLARKINAAIETDVQTMITEITLDAEWLDKLEKLVNQRMTDRLLSLISGINLNHLIQGEIDRGIDRWHNRLTDNFYTRGIVDNANQCELTVIDGAVVASNGLAASNLLIENSANIQGSLTVNNLEILGTVNMDHDAFQSVVARAGSATISELTDSWRESLVQQVLDLARSSGINFSEITLNGNPILQDGCLNAAITSSNLTRVGALESITVLGSANLSDTLWSSGHRVGINTCEPESALTVWDEEVCVTIGKHQKNSAYLGTSRKQSLGIGVNRNVEIMIDTEGLTSVRKLRIDRWRILWSDQVPGWSGTRGDIAFNSNPTVGSPWAWQCLGGYKWQPLAGRE